MKDILILKDNNLEKEYSYVKNKLKKKDNGFIINGFVYWCIFRDIDPRVCAYIVLEELNLDVFLYKYKNNNILKQLYKSIKSRIEKDRLFREEETVLYNEIFDIIFLIQYREKIKGKNKSCQDSFKSLKYTITGIFRDIFSIIKNFLMLIFNKIKRN